MKQYNVLLLNLQRKTSWYAFTTPVTKEEAKLFKNGYTGKSEAIVCIPSSYCE